MIKLHFCQWPRDNNWDAEHTGEHYDQRIEAKRWIRG
jgi:hypothetical protein